MTTPPSPPLAFELLRLRDEVLDLEDFNESVVFNQFTLDDFRQDLANFITVNQQLLRDAPFGLYALVPAAQADKAQAAINSGVIYCLRQTSVASASEPKTAKTQETINPLSPFFLVYILTDGTVRYNFTARKQVLDIFRALCQGQTAPYAELCQLFDLETRHGQDMQAYSALLDKAVQAIVAQFGQKNAANLFSGRSGKLLDAAQAVQGQQDFELVTWLVIK